jgi:hypothetical protein
LAKILAMPGVDNAGMNLFPILSSWLHNLMQGFSGNILTLFINFKLHVPFDWHAL